ncbi:unnamed protein product [Mytilus coruscus]|uniref:Uncharacterized protein n=1 Tax=Mytilus coruscus TaxID=42192 RepID=A0A6J8CRM4_MYTCO|nr:unnamed protein product [Mytilus coruscus]
MNIIDREKQKEFSSLLLQCKQYLRTDFEVHIAANSEVGDHCLMYALSDSIHPQFAHPCQHQHNLGIETAMKNVKYRVSAVEYNPSKKTAFEGIPAIGSYSNFQFEEQGIRDWKAHGSLIANEKIPAITFKPLTVLKVPDQISFHPIIGSKRSANLVENSNRQDVTKNLFTCTNDGYLASFESDEALTNHIIVGKWCIELDHKSSINSDVTKHIYLQKNS